MPGKEGGAKAGRAAGGAEAPNARAAELDELVAFDALGLGGDRDESDLFEGGFGRGPGLGGDDGYFLVQGADADSRAPSAAGTTTTSAGGSRLTASGSGRGGHGAAAVEPQSRIRGGIREAGDGGIDALAGYGLQTRRMVAPDLPAANDNDFDMPIYDDHARGDRENEQQQVRPLGGSVCVHMHNSPLTIKKYPLQLAEHV